MELLFILCFLFFVGDVSSTVTNKQRVFEVDYENNQFMKDGEPFRYISGSLHYFRVPRAYWQDRLRKLRAAGLNVVTTYVEWSSHEPRPGVYDFSGDNDLEFFVTLAQEEGLLVILRPGPYICAERDFGGYPPWLLHENSAMVLRTNDSSHTKYVYKWLSVLMPRIKPLLYGNGGPVIMVQVENEYGSYSVCDKDYKLWLRDVFQSYVGKEAVLFTTDGAWGSFLQCGPIPGVFITVDFGSGLDVANAFQPLRKIQPSGPLVNSEFYPGWLTHWGESKASVATDTIVETTRALLEYNASLNFYLFFGGTNFGFTSGANNPPFLPQITSYDYDAPLTEAGDMTDKYNAIKSVISEFELQPEKEIPVANSTKMSYGTLRLNAKISLFDSDVGVQYNSFVYPQTFEALQLYSGFMLYETILPENFSGRGFLVAKHVHDRAIVYIDQRPVGLFSRSQSTNSLEISGSPGQTLGLLVENQGHINYGRMLDLKGLLENVTLNGDNLTNWKQTGFPLDNVTHIPDLFDMEQVKLPAFYSGTFKLPEYLTEACDTFVDVTGWTKGILYINGHNLGRYWPAEGPQVTLYLPGPFLHKYPIDNKVIVMELERENPSRTIAFVTTPIWLTNSRRL